MQAKDRLIVALDVDTAAQALSLVEVLAGHVGAFKVGMQLFNSAGPEMVRALQQRGEKVFVDLKFHDIPNTVAQAGRIMTGFGVFMYNLHIAGGKEMLRQTVQATKEEAASLGQKPPLVVGVTVLTSLSHQELQEEVGVKRNLEEQVVHFARMAQEAGLDGVVASPQEIPLLREACGADFLIITPGVRPAGAQMNDQKRVLTPGEAIAAGASYLVVGRPITTHPDPQSAAKAIVQEMAQG